MNHDYASIRDLLADPRTAGHLLWDNLDREGFTPEILYVAGGCWVITVDAPGGEIWIADEAKITHSTDEHHFWTAIFYPARSDCEIGETIYDGLEEANHQADTIACIAAVAERLSGRS